MNDRELKAISVCRYFNAGFMVLVALFFFLVPGAIVIRELSDPGIRSAGIPRSAWRLHKTMSAKYEEWATRRVKSSRASKLSTDNISGTEWPLFGSVFYLWGTESLQDAWDRDHRFAEIAPNVHAKGAIEAAARLVADPGQANWVKRENYLKKEDAFYR